MYYNNTFNGGVTRPTSANNNVTRDPLFVSPNTTGNLAGFLLQSTSSERSTGAIIASNGGKDFWGVTLPDHRAPSRSLANQCHRRLHRDADLHPRLRTIDGEHPAIGQLPGRLSPPVRDQNFRLISSPAITWSIIPAVSGFRSIRMAC